MASGDGKKIVNLEGLKAAYDYLDGKIETSSAGSIARPSMIYCWGDSLTEGVGGHVLLPDGHNAYMAYSYPAWLSQSYNVVNLGARGEDIHAIMARQGADPIVLQSAITIPASKNTPVKIGEMSRLFTYGSGTGLESESGAMVKICKEVESPGLNPCSISGVKGTIYRELGSDYLTDEATYNVYFKRLEDGEETSAEAGTEVVTHAMENYRNGVAIIWMGANGGYSSHTDFVDKVLQMVEYGKYINYLVILSREFSDTYARQVAELLIDDEGVEHCLYLRDLLPTRGYMMAGIGRNSVDTSGWSTSDVIKKSVPLLCEYLSGQSGENQYGELHYSAWGYKAIAKLIQEKLSTMVIGSSTPGGGGGGAEPEPEVTGDDYGTYLYKLKNPRTLSGTSYINTKVKLYETVDMNWTVVIKYHGTVLSTQGVPYNILNCMHDGQNDGLLFRYHLPDNDSSLSSSNYGAMIQLGSGAFSIEGTNGTINRGGTNIIIVCKSGSSYSAYLNSKSMSYGAPLVYTLDSSKAHELPLLIGGRWNTEGTEVQFLTSMVIDDLRVYDDALSNSDVSDLYDELSESGT